MATAEHFYALAAAVGKTWPPGTLASFEVTANSWDCIKPDSTEEAPFDLAPLAAALGPVASTSLKELKLCVSCACVGRCRSPPRATSSNGVGFGILLPSTNSATYTLHTCGVSL